MEADAELKKLFYIYNQVPSQTNTTYKQNPPDFSTSKVSDFQYIFNDIYFLLMYISKSVSWARVQAEAEIQGL